MDKRERYHELVTGEFREIYEEELARVAEEARAAVRPAENALLGRGGTTVRADASKLTAKERAELARKAARGERVTI
ncbi:hypothetical protein FACS1894217_02630 [Clostridia bacterium]|nr:hypothetical protein FACS1894217_02630 [Clostridia bacterium]